jgi:hypothetical protein
MVSSCSHRIVRNGYDVKKADYRNCDIEITKNLLPTDSLQKVGEIKLGESGLAVACSEAHAIEILKNEACALNAHIVNITEETRPNAWSSCYRCRAEFYRYTNQAKMAIQSEAFYNPENVKKRVSQDRGRNTAYAVGAVAIGFIFGLLVF